MCARPAKLAILVGSHRFRCQDLNEIGFRSYVREHAAEIEVIDAGASLEESRLAKELTLHLLQRHADLAGLYVAGGGIRGVLEALKEAGALGRVMTVCSELTAVTRAGLTEGHIKLVIAHPVQTLAAALVTAMAEAAISRSTATLAKITLPFDLFISENV
jgi:LacI family transcriptional regulator